jgi:hypothetical protein
MSTTNLSAVLQPRATVPRAERTKLAVYERQLADALRHARDLAGEKDTAPFARRVFAELGLADPPSERTWIRWEEGTATMPAWALIGAARLVGQSIEALVAKQGNLIDITDLIDARLRALGLLRDEDPS